MVDFIYYRPYQAKSPSTLEKFELNKRGGPWCATGGLRKNSQKPTKNVTFSRKVTKSGQKPNYERGDLARDRCPNAKSG